MVLFLFWSLLSSADSLVNKKDETILTCLIANFSADIPN